MKVTLDGLADKLKARTLQFCDFDDLCAHFGGHPLTGTWQQDVVFAREQTHGILPTLLRRATDADFKRPDTIDPSKVSAAALGGMTLKDGIRKGHIFVMDYRRILEVGCTDANYCSSPLAAFFTAAKSFTDMVPLAIQLFKGGPIYTPSDTAGNHWLARRSSARTAAPSRRTPSSTTSGCTGSTRRCTPRPVATSPRGTR